MIIREYKITPKVKNKGFPFFPKGIECLVTVKDKAPIIKPSNVRYVIVLNSLNTKIENKTPNNVEKDITIFINLDLVISTGIVFTPA